MSMTLDDAWRMVAMLEIVHENEDGILHALDYGDFHEYFPEFSWGLAFDNAGHWHLLVREKTPEELAAEERAVEEL